MIDGSIIRANQCAAGYSKKSNEDLERSCGGFSTKIHVLVDALGNPVKFVLSSGNEHDLTRAEELAENLENTKILGDKGYDSQKFVDFLGRRNCEAAIPARSNCKKKREIDKRIYKERYLIETFFGKIKRCRRVFSKILQNFLLILAFLAFH